MKNKSLWKEWFYLSRSEQRGTLVLFAIILVLAASRWYNRSQDEGIPILETQILKEVERIDSISYPPKETIQYSSSDKKSNYESKKRYPDKSYSKPKYPTSKWEKKPSRFINEPLNLNRADSALLDELPSIGPFFAKRILKYRNILGGFVSKEQLLEVYGFDSVRFAQIENLISLGEPLNTLNINTDSLYQLRKHPYISASLAKAILRYKEQHGSYKSVDELKSVYLINDSIFGKLEPYLRIN